MNEHVKRLAEQAGFCMWGSEAHRPEGATVDWSCDYDKELEEFYNLIIDDKETQ
jgi:hypothetical protein